MISCETKNVVPAKAGASGNESAPMLAEILTFVRMTAVGGRA